MDETEGTIKDKPMSDSASTKRYPVLIAGAGPVGLSLAIELAWRGIRCLVVEQSDGAVDFPTTNLANTRTCEHLRRWGLADRLRYESGYPTDYPRNYLFVTRMNGYEIARFDHPANGDPNSRSPYSPEGRLWISKPYFDPVLHKHVSTLPTVEVRYRTALESFRQDDEKVVADIVDVTSGQRSSIEAAYLVGCDGGRSTVRRQLGIQFEGVFAEGMKRSRVVSLTVIVADPSRPRCAVSDSQPASPGSHCRRRWQRTVALEYSRRHARAIRFAQRAGKVALRAWRKYSL